MHYTVHCTWPISRVGLIDLWANDEAHGCTLLYCEVDGRGWYVNEVGGRGL